VILFIFALILTAVIALLFSALKGRRLSFLVVTFDILGVLSVPGTGYIAAFAAVPNSGDGSGLDWLLIVTASTGGASSA